MNVLPQLPSHAPARSLNVAVIGLGVIGGSILRNLSRLHINHAGFDSDEVQSAAADRAGLVTASTAHNAARNADLVYLCVPSSALYEAARATMPHLAMNAMVVATPSTMTDALHLLEKAKTASGRKDLHVVIAHPMAGSASSGFLASSDELFLNCTWVINEKDGTATPIDARVVQLLSSLALAMGAERIVRADAEVHDRAVAACSHLVQGVSSALAGAVNEYVKQNPAVPVFTLAAGGWKDTTRVAESSAQMWTPIFLANHEHVVPLIDSVIERLQELKRASASKDRSSIERFMREGNEARRRWAEEKQ